MNYISARQFYFYIQFNGEALSIEGLSDLPGVRSLVI